MAIINRDKNYENKGELWVQRTKYIVQAKRELAEEAERSGEGPAGDLKKRAIRARATLLAQAFIEALKEQNLTDVFGSAGERLTAAASLEEDYTEAYDKYLQDPSNEELRLETERLHEELVQSGDYQTLIETGDQQVEYLKALDFMDTIGPNIRIFNVCRAKSKWDFKKEVACSCGLAYPNKLWLQPDKSRWKWVCSLDWKELIKAQEQFPHNEDLGTWVKDLKEKYGSVESWPKIGCHANFVPYKKGASQVVELRMGNGEWQSFMAERMPQELDDAIKGHHAKFYMAQKMLTPQELMDVLPCPSLPRTK